MTNYSPTAFTVGRQGRHLTSLTSLLLRPCLPASSKLPIQASKLHRLNFISCKLRCWKPVAMFSVMWSRLPELAPAKVTVPIVSAQAVSY